MTTPNREFPNLHLIRQGIEFRFPVKIRGFTLMMRPLAIEEEDAVTQEVISELNELEEVKRTSLKQSALLSLKKLVLAQTSDVGKNDEKVGIFELQRLTAGEIEFIFKNYISACDKINPSVDNISTEEVTAWVETLKKNSSDQEMTLIGLSFFQLVAICRHLLTTGESPAAS